MNFIDRLRIEDAIIRYDFWLSVDSVGGKRRKEFRRDLRANLLEASEHGGAKAALHRLGSIRRLAIEASPDRHHKPRWVLGLYAWEITLGLMIWTALIAAGTFADGAAASGVTGRKISGAVTFLPGMHATYEKTSEGMSFGASPGLMPLILPVLVGLLVAKPWRLWTTPGAQDHQQFAADRAASHS